MYSRVRTHGLLGFHSNLQGVCRGVARLEGGGGVIALTPHEQHALSDAPMLVLKIDCILLHDS